MIRPDRLSLRVLLLLLVLGSTLGATVLSLVHRLEATETRVWEEARQQAQREIALLSLVSERLDPRDRSLLAELVVQATADPRVAYVAVLDPSREVIASTRLTDVGRSVTALPDLSPAWLDELRSGGVARLQERPEQGELVLSHAFPWPASAGKLRDYQAGVVVLRYQLDGQLRQMWRESFREFLVDAWLFLLAGGVLFLMLERLVRRPLSQLGDAAAALGAGDLAHRVPSQPTREMERLVQAFNRMADGLQWRVAQLQDSEARLRATLALAPDAILTVRGDGAVEACNAAAERLFGYDKADVAGRPLGQLIAPDAGLPPTDEMSAFAAAAQTLSEDYRSGSDRPLRGLRADGEVLELDIAVSAVAMGEGPRYILVLRDVSERNALARELQMHRHHLEALVVERTSALARSNEAAQAATRAKSEFLANMSHEIRTPMSAILALAHLARRGATPEQVASLDKLDGAARHLLAILNDILDVSKIEAGKLVLSRQDFSLDDVIDRACHLVSERAIDKGIEVVQRVDPLLPSRLHGDELRLGQVLVNLIGNAVKFTERGHVQVSLTQVAGADGQRWARFEVRDTGIGMDREQQARVFSAFEQADGSTTRRFGGTGLGLTISRRLVELMGGTLQVESQEGVGSRFWFDLPLEVARSGGDWRRPAVVRFVGTRALVVDDLAEARLALVEMLTMLGLRASAVESGPQALAALREADAQGAPFDLCVLDWRMPEMDGIETARAIRSAGLSHQPACMMISAMGGQLPHDAVADVGFSAVLVKPVSPSQLHDALARSMRQSAAGTVGAGRMPEPRWRADPGARVLLVEDNPLNREVSGQLLEELGLRPDLAEDGQKALDLALQHRYDLILMDMQMPRMDGLEATRRIRRLAAHVATPIVALTANAYQEDRERCREAGMDDFLSKPVDPLLLAQTLERWLSTSSADASQALPAAREGTAVWAGPWIGGLDLARALERLRGNQDTLWRLLAMFVTHHAGEGEALRAARASGERDALKQRLHALRGALGTLEGGALVARIRWLEQAMAGDAWPAAQDLLGLADALDALVTEMREALARR